jgi:O-antigen ligase
LGELVIVTAIWCAAIGVCRMRGMPAGLRLMSVGLGREHLALALLMLATHARTEREGAAAALSNPFTVETVARAVIVMSAFALVVPLYAKRVRLAQAVRRHWYGVICLAIYTGVAAVSITWSKAPMVTAGKALEIGITYALVWALLARPDREDALKRSIHLVLVLEGILIVIAVIGFFVLPGTFTETQSRTGFVFEATLVAPYLGSNGFSAIGAMLAAFALAQYFISGRRGSGAWLWVIAFGTASIVLGSGRQGVAIWVVSIAALLWVYRRELFLLVVAPLATTVFAVYGTEIITSLTRGQVEGSLSTLTGRTTFWRAAIDAFKDRPITGYGYGAGGRYEALARIGLGQYTHVHNGYLETLVGVGIVGFVPFIIATLRMVWWGATRLLRRVDAPYAVLVVPLILQNAIGMGFGAWLNTHLILFGLIVALSDSQGMKAPKRLARRRAARARLQNV